MDERIEAQKEISKSFTDDSADVLKRLEVVEAFISDTPKAAATQRVSNITPAQAVAAKAAAGPVEMNPMYPGMNVPMDNNSGGQS